MEWKARIWTLRLAALAGAAIAGPAGASSDFGCYFSASLENGTSPCGNTAAIAPGNDTRVNLNYLLRDARGLSPVPSNPPRSDWWSEFDASHFGFHDFRRGYWPQDDDGQAGYYDFSGSRCQSVTSGTVAFTKALEMARGIVAGEKQRLTVGRAVLTELCDARDGEHSAERSPAPSKAEAAEFYDYIWTSYGFYAGDWQAAREGYQKLARAANPWVRETSLYMLARVDINAAQDGAFGRWGEFEGATDAGRKLALRAGEGFEAYLAAYPDGRYAASARGLQRRVLWLAGDEAALARTYASLLRSMDAESLGYADLLDEVDNKLLTGNEEGADLPDPLLLATWDLQNMRRWLWDEEETQDGLLSAADLAAQEPLFEGHEDLFAFLQANHAYYVARDYRRVMELIPDAARQDSYTALEFSRQVLRGMALAQRKDRNEAGFWLDLLGGAHATYQRPLVELGLALNYERNGKLDAVFAEGSPITDPGIRMTLLRESAGPDILRATAGNSARPMPERRTAMRALLWKDLSRARYAEFVRDYAMLESFAKDAPYNEETYTSEQYPLDEFRTGTWQEDYACPDIRWTASTLARDPRDAQALLCLGDFYRLNSFDMTGGRYRYGPPNAPPQLGDGPDRFAGALVSRQSLYQQVIADPRAGANERAYALYRAVWCYGPSGNNDCGGEDVAKSQRQAWFRELKTRYAGSRWAKDLKYYW